VSTKESSGKISSTPKKVAICVPSGDTVHADFAMALAGLTYRCGPGQATPAIPIALINVKSSLVINGRNGLVQQAQSLGVDYLLFIDSDVVVHPLTLHRLLALDKDIVGGTYVQREEPHRLLGNAIDGTLLGDWMQGRTVNSRDLTEVSALPAGCLLIKMSVFDKLAKPYFQTPAQETDGVHWIEGEDYFFCRNARAAGFQVWLDWGTSMAINHIGQKYNSLPATQVQTENEHAVIH
jgi:hypothetical protein